MVCSTSIIGINKTDSNGVASLHFTLPGLDLFETIKTGQTTKTGTYKINAVFSGTANYARSSSEDVYIAYVFIDYTPYIVGCGILAVAVIGIVGYIGFRQRKLVRSPAKDFINKCCKKSILKLLILVYHRELLNIN